MPLTLAVTALYAGLLLLAFSLRVILRRRAAKVSVGDGDDRELRKRIRVQANCAEYAPLALLLLTLAEAQGTPGSVLHLLGLMLLAGRLAHAAGLGATPQIVPLRQAGMALTFLMILAAALANFGHALT